eukprot:TRINITY_DN73156_c0_g1_i1.p1 TRINITY_DN73156_c0_g1~~TRINITY_DN73156_c0_g1_i1.p1  ORF type:complete len:888 (+),score=147.01 TRINITY_DN73156_c0_g1_i1:80-2743(+)
MEHPPWQRAEAMRRTLRGDEETLGDWRLKLVNTTQQFDLAHLVADEQHRDEASDQDSPDSDDSSSEADLKIGGFKNWVRSRVGTKARFGLMLAFVVIEGARTRMTETGQHVDLTEHLMCFCYWSSVTSVVLGLVISFAVSGREALPKLFNPHAFACWSLVALGFAGSNALGSLAYQHGLTAVFDMLVGNLYVPIAVLISFFVFSRVYGQLEWLSITMFVLSTSAFFILRQRCDKNYCHFLDWSEKGDGHGVALKLAGVVLGVYASVYAERLFKMPSRGQVENEPYYIDRVHLDTAGTALMGLYRLWPGSKDQFSHSHFKEPVHFVLVAVLVAEMWLAGLMCKNFSTVTKALIQTLTAILSICIFDPLSGITYGHNWGLRAVPSLMIVVIVILSMVIFQTGRLNLSYMRKMHGIVPRYEFGGLRMARRFFSGQPTSEGDEAQPVVEAYQQGYDDAVAGKNFDPPRVKDIEPAEDESSCMDLLSKFSLPVLYIVANALQTELQNTVSANRYFVPQSLQVAIPLAGMSMAIFLTWSQMGCSRVKEAFDFKIMPKFLVLGLMQSTTGALAGMAMGLGINSSLYVAMGKIYTPLSLILGKLVMKRKYLWIEWMSVTILFDASITLAMLDTAVPSGKSKGSSLAAIICVAASASMACLYSIMMEIMLQGSDTPFLVNKIRLDLGAFLWGFAFLPLMGILGEKGGRPDLAFWVYRPSPYWQCEAIGSCDQASGSFVLSNATAGLTVGQECVCGNGVLLGWDSWIVYAALAVGVLYGWLTGKVIQNFSTVMRSVFDGFPIVLLWFIVTPTASRIPLAPFQAAYYQGPVNYINQDWAKDLMTLVNPVSAINYIAAAAQVRKVAELSQAQAEAELIQESEDSDDDWEELEAKALEME